MKTEAYLRIVEMSNSEDEKARTMALALLDPNRTPETMPKAWHTGMGAPVGKRITTLSVADIDRRLRLTFEEYKETVKASGFEFVSASTGEVITSDITLVPIPGVVQDLVEISDGIADVLVVDVGHAVEHGLPITEIFDEVMWSNGTKLPLDGIPILNRCLTSDTQPDHNCETHPNDCVLLDPAAPINKILKPSTYVKADIKAVLARQGEDY